MLSKSDGKRNEEQQRPEGNYRMTYASDDGENRKKIVINNRKIKSGKTLKIKLLSGGGYLAKFERTDK